MPELVPNQRRYDPYRSYKFRVKWDGQVVAGVSKVTALRRSTEVLEFREVGDPTPRPVPGRIRYAPVTLERGLTGDPAFADWADAAATPDGDGPARKSVTIEFYSEAGERVLAYTLLRCWVSAYQALPDLDADANAVAVETLTLEHEGWKREAAAPDAEPWRYPSA